MKNEKQAERVREELPKLLEQADPKNSPYQRLTLDNLVRIVGAHFELVETQFLDALERIIASEPARVAWTAGELLGRCNNSHEKVISLLVGASEEEVTNFLKKLDRQMEAYINAPL